MPTFFVTALPPLAALLAWGWLLARALRLRPGFAPLLGIAFALVFLQAAGALNLLWPGAALLLAGGPLLCAGVCLRGAKRPGAERPAADLLRTLAAPGCIGFLAACAAALIAYTLAAPRFQTWDEFSHWGVFFKSVFYDHRFDIWMTGRSFEHQAYPQGLPGLYALFALLRPAYAERDVFFAVNLPLYAAAGALFALPSAARRGARAALAVCAAVSVPFAFAVFSPDTPYLTAYMDAPVGALFAAGLLLCLLPELGGARGGLAVGLLGAAAATVKEIGAVFALCLLGIWLVQCLWRGRKQVWRPFLPAAALAGGSILFWKAALHLLNRNVDQFSSMGLSGFLSAWGAARSGADPYFDQVFAAFYAKVRTAPLLFGWSTAKLGAVCALLSVLLCLALWRAGARRQAAVPGLVLLYFPCYLFALFYVYMGGMSAYEALQVASYGRYACCFFIGWFAVLAAGVFLLCSLLPHRPRVLGTAALCALLAANGLPHLFVPGSYTLPREPWRDEQIAAAAALHTAFANPNAGIWLLSADAETAYQTMWYYHYELYPDNVCIEVPSAQAGVDLDYNFKEHSIAELVLFGVDEEFAQKYAAWFTDGLAAARAGSPAVYRVTRSAAAPAGWLLEPAQ